MRRDQSVKQGDAETLARERNTGVELRKAADSLHFPQVEIKKKRKKKKNLNVRQSGYWERKEKHQVCYCYY